VTVRGCCPLMWVVRHSRGRVELKRPLSCSSCVVNRAYCEAFCRGDVWAINYASFLEELMLIEGSGGDGNVRKIGN